MSKKSRTKYSVYNAISATILMLVNGLFSIFVTRLVIDAFGSDFNGLNSTVNQIINVLMIIEGGITMASNVALFSPISNDDYDVSNGILKATRSKFRRVGILFLVVGIIASFVYSFLAKTNLSHEFVFTIMFMAVVPQAFDLFLTSTYKVVLQAQQKEYIINSFRALTIAAGQVTNIVLILNDGQMWMVRFVTMVFSFVNCILIIVFTKRNNRFIDYSCEALPNLIKGTNDVMAQKITSMVYSSWPIVFLSISSKGGTMLASVYAVYNSVLTLVKSLVYAMIDAPRFGFGQLLTEKPREDVWKSFKQYEFLTIFITFVLLSTTAALIMPFINLYTSGVNDIDYYDTIIATLMLFISVFEIIHIPSGHIINMSGNFKTSKKIQIAACITLVISMMILGYFGGVYGMLLSILIAAILLAILEIGFIHKKFFSKKLFIFFRFALPYTIVGIIVSYIEIIIEVNIDSFIKLIIYAFVYFFVNAIISLLLGFIVERNTMKELFSRFYVMIKRQ